MATTPRQLFRASRASLCRRLAPDWRGTRAELKRAVSHFLKPYRRRFEILFTLLRDPRRAALFAAALLAGTGALSPSAQAHGATILLSDVAAGQGGFAIDAETTRTQLGFAVSPVGDMNGDGLADLLVGAPRVGSNAGNAPPGRAYLVFGKDSGTSVSAASITHSQGGFAINGTFIDGAGEEAGYSVAQAGDINGDGIPDMLVSTYDDYVPSRQSISYIVFGKADATSISLASVGAGIGGFPIVSDQPNESIGISLMGHADINGDGFDDLILGADGYSGPGIRGRAYVVFGKASGTTVSLANVAHGSGGFVINGPAAPQNFGYSVAVAGDVNGDGLPDLIIGNSVANPNGIASGQAEVVFGKTDGTSVSLSNVAAGIGGFVINGGFASQFAGVSVAGAGDVNGDGLSDVIVGATTGDLSGPGQSYVVFGKADGSPITLSTATLGTHGFLIKGEVTGDFSGGHVAAAGDINGDGLADLLVTANFSLVTPAHVGRNYVVFGQRATTQVNLANVVSGVGGFPIDAEAPGDLQSAACSPGDVNGDGLPDLLIGAPFNAANGKNSGRAYVVFDPLTPQPSATYFAHDRIGDGPGGHIVPLHDFSDARFTIKYPDNDTGSDGTGHASTTTVTLTRSKSAIHGSGITTNTLNIANVMWRITSNRTPLTSATITLKYIDSEIAGMTVPEKSLAIFHATSPSGPWTQLLTTLNPNNNQARATTPSLGYFAIAAAAPGTNVINYLLGVTNDPTGLDSNGDHKVDAGDLVFDIKHNIN